MVDESNNVMKMQLPEVAQWDAIRPHMRRLSKLIILCLDHATNCIKPTEEIMKEVVLEVFNVAANDYNTRSVFNKSWTSVLK